MNPQTPHHSLAGDEGGFVLIFALLVLVTLTLLGFMAVDTAVNENNMSGNDRVQRQTFSLTDGGTQAAIHLLQQNMDCPNGFPATLLAQGTGQIRFTRSAVFNGTPNDNDYSMALPAAVRTQAANVTADAAAATPPAVPANVYDPATFPAPEIYRQFCIPGEGISIPGNISCTPFNGAPHTNILYNPDPSGVKHHTPGENSNLTGGGTGQGYNSGAGSGGITSQVQIFSQHVAYRPNGVTTRESIIQMTWAQPNNSFNNCLW